MKILFFILIALPLQLVSQDTLVAEIKITKSPSGVEVSYSKDLRYSDEEIARYISSVFKFDSLLPPKREPKIIKM